MMFVNQFVHVLYHMVTVSVLLLILYKLFNIANLFRILLEAVLANTYMYHKYVDKHRNPDTTGLTTTSDEELNKS